MALQAPASREMIPFHAEKAYLWGLVLALPENTRRPRGKLDNLLNRLQKETERRLRRLPALSDSDIAACVRKYERFAASTGWGERDDLSVLTWTNFLLALLDDCPPGFGKAIEILTKIAEYLERAGTRPEEYDEAAEKAEVFLG